jgi:hypothetical protein
MPVRISLPAWRPEMIFPITPGWVADDYSWVYAICLATLALAVISTAAIRKLSRSINWAAILFITAIGLLAVTSQNLTSVVLTWIGLDLTELIFSLYSNRGDKSEEIVISFVIRLGGVLLITWSSIFSVNQGSLMDLSFIPSGAGILIYLAIVFRLGIIPFHLPKKDEERNRGVITAFRLVSAGSALSLLPRISAMSFPSNYQPYVLMAAGLFSIAGSLLWLLSPDGFSGRSYWILSLSALAFSATLIGNLNGSVSWSITLILAGGLIFIYSHRNRRNLWLPLFGLIGFSTLPFSATASVWSNQLTSNPIALFPQAISFSLLISGYIKHALLSNGTTDHNSEPGWITTIYTFGLFSFPILLIILGLWGWQGARIINIWWLCGGAIAFSIVVFGIVKRQTENLDRFQIRSSQIHSNLLSNTFWTIYHGFRRLIQLISSILEGDAGILWSIVLMVLIISLFLQIIPGTP